MDNKATQNIQDSFLNAARKDKLPVTTYLVSGVKLTGRIRAFDKYSVVMDTNNQEQLIFKHAIASVVMARGARHGEATAANTAAPVESSGESSGESSANGSGAHPAESPAEPSKGETVSAPSRG